MPDYQKIYTQMVVDYKKLLNKAGDSVIASGDKSKLIKALDQMALGLKECAAGDKYTEENNAMVAEMTKLAAKFKKFNTDVKKYNNDLDAYIKDCNSAKSIASGQKGFSKSKDFEKMDDDMRDVADWLDICKHKEMVFTEFAAAM